MIKGVFRLIALLLAVVGAGAVWGAVRPLPGTPLEFSALVGFGGFTLIFLGYWLWRKMGGAPIFEW